MCSCCVNTSVVVLFYIFCYFTNLFCLFESSENSKKGKFVASSICSLVSYLGYELINFYGCFWYICFNFICLTFGVCM